MRHTYWLISNKLCARPGPNEAPWDPQELHNAGVRAVLSVNKADGVVPRELTRLGISYKRVTLPMATPPGVKDMRICQRRLPKAYRFAKEQIDAGRPLLVHCRHGKDRTGLFLAYYLARHYSMSADQAIAQVRARRPSCLRAQGWQQLAQDLIGEATPIKIAASL